MLGHLLGGKSRGRWMRLWTVTWLVIDQGLPWFFILLAQLPTSLQAGVRLPNPFGLLCFCVRCPGPNSSCTGASTAEVGHCPEEHSSCQGWHIAEPQALPKL